MTKPANFNIIARPYRWLEYLTLGPFLTHARLNFLSAVSHSTHAYILGDGDGRFTAVLLLRAPAIHVTAVDTSRTMLQLLRRRSHSNPRLTTLHADALTTSAPPQTDLVVTHFFLDCLTQPQLETLITATTPHLTAEALWLISDFRIPSGAMHWPARIFIRLLYFAFHIMTGLRVTHLPDHHTPLCAAGFTCINARQRLFGILTSELWQRAALAPPDTLSTKK